MTREQYKALCRKEKTASYRWLLTGRLLAAAGIIAAGAAVLLGYWGILSFSAELPILIAAAVTACMGIAANLVGEALTERGHKATVREGSFQSSAKPKSFKLENQSGAIHRFTEAHIDNALQDLFCDSDQFLILEAPKPSHGIRYVQARQAQGWILLQLGMEEQGQIRLVEKLCRQEACRRVFLEFYRGSYAPGKWEYRDAQM